MSEDVKELRNIVEAALLASEVPLSNQRLLNLFATEARPDKKQLTAALELLGADCEHSGLELKKIGKGWRLQTKDKYAPWLRKLRESRPPRYSRALLETLSIIAYRQPVTRADIEEIRGVSVTSDMMRTLLDREWISQVGYRDVPGRPALWGTTPAFLAYFNLEALTDLPELHEQRDINTIAQELSIELPLDKPESPADADVVDAELDSEVGADSVQLDGTLDEVVTKDALDLSNTEDAGVDRGVIDDHSGTVIPPAPDSLMTDPASDSTSDPVDHPDAIESDVPDDATYDQADETETVQQDDVNDGSTVPDFDKDSKKEVQDTEGYSAQPDVSGDPPASLESTVSVDNSDQPTQDSVADPVDAGIDVDANSDVENPPTEAEQFVLEDAQVEQQAFEQLDDERQAQRREEEEEQDGLLDHEQPTQTPVDKAHSLSQSSGDQDASILDEAPSAHEASQESWPGSTSEFQTDDDDGSGTLNKSNQTTQPGEEPQPTDPSQPGSLEETAQSTNNDIDDVDHVDVVDKMPSSGNDAASDDEPLSRTPINDSSDESEEEPLASPVTDHTAAADHDTQTQVREEQVASNDVTRHVNARLRGNLQRALDQLPEDSSGVSAEDPQRNHGADVGGVPVDVLIMDSTMRPLEHPDEINESSRSDEDDESADQTKPH